MKQFSLIFWVLFIGLGWSMTGCIDDTFDEPPIDGEPSGLTANATIADVLAKGQPGEVVEITEDLLIEGIVISSDEAGNFYKNLVIQDATGGINLSINESDLFGKYPRYRKVFVRCQGLSIGFDNDLPELGAGETTNYFGDKIVEQIPKALIEDHLVQDLKNQPSPATEKTVAEITLADLNTLVTLRNVEFAVADTGQTMAEPSAGANRFLVDCISNGMILRNSNYADFADLSVPNMNGSVTAVVSIYNGDMQLLLSYFEDMDMQDERCDGGGGSVGDWSIQGSSAVVDSIDEPMDGISNNEDFLTIGWLNATDVSGGRYWQGKVFGDENYIQATAYNDNVSPTHTWVITPGISDIGSKILSFKSAQAYGYHDGLKVFISTDFDGADIDAATWSELSPTLANASNADHEWVESGKMPLSAYSGVGYVAFEYSGVTGTETTSFRIDDVVINTTGNSSGSSGGPDITQIGDWYIQGTSATQASLNEPFDGIDDSGDFLLPGWLNGSKVEDGLFWQNDEFDGTKYIHANAYDGTGAMHTMVITPGISDIGTKTLSFESAMHHHNGDLLTVVISTDFDGSDIGAATWIELSPTLAGSAQSNYDWVASGDVDLSAYSGTGYIGFQYIGDKNGETTGFQLDNVVIE